MSDEAMRWALHGPKGLDGTDRLVLIVLADQANEAHECQPGLLRIVEISGLSKRTVQRSLGRLKDRGVVAEQHKRGTSGAQRASTYALRVSGPGGQGA